MAESIGEAERVRNVKLIAKECTSTVGADRYGFDLIGFEL